MYFLSFLELVSGKRQGHYEDKRDGDDFGVWAVNESKQQVSQTTIPLLKSINEAFWIWFQWRDSFYGKVEEPAEFYINYAASNDEGQLDLKVDFLVTLMHHNLQIIWQLANLNST